MSMPLKELLPLVHEPIRREVENLAARCFALGYCEALIQEGLNKDREYEDEEQKAHAIWRAMRTGRRPM